MYVYIINMVREYATVGTFVDAGRTVVKYADDVADATADGLRAGGRTFDDVNPNTFDASGFKVADDAFDAGIDAGTTGAQSTSKTVLKKTSGFIGNHFKELATFGFVVGGAIYLENKYDEASEAMIECQGKCLPENYDLMPPYGTLERKDLIYSTNVASETQPVCTSDHVDCGDYCGAKCEAIHDYDPPGASLLGGVAEDLGGLINDALGGIFDGFDPSIIGLVLGVFACLMMLGLMLKLKSLTSSKE
jgi:hypothetical protein